MKPTHDLARAIMPYGKHIRVLEPESFRKELHNMAQAVADANDSDENIERKEQAKMNREAAIEAIKGALKRRKEKYGHE
jgi:hypothetical protein